MSLDVANINANPNSRNSMDDDDNEGLVLREIGSLSLRRRTSTNTLSDFGDRKVIPALIFEYCRSILRTFQINS